MNIKNNLMEKILRFLKLASLAASLLVLPACGGGGSGGGITTVISGIVSDDPVVGATVTATSVDSGVVLGSATTAADASYSLNVTTANIGTGYVLRSMGGTMNGLAFNDTLSAIYPANANSQQANLTLITSALVEAVNITTRHTGTALQKHEAIKAEATSRGLIGTDYNQVQPTGTLMASLQNRAATSGATAAIRSQANTINFVPPDPGTCKNSGTETTCTQDVNPGKSLSLTVQGATASAPVGALNSCRVVASFDGAGQSMAMWVENIPSTTPNSTAPFQCQATGSVTLTLPPSTAEAPDACLAPLSRGSSTPSCVTIGSGMTPTYSFNDGAGHSHRTDKNPHSSIPVFGRTATFSRSYGAVLNVSAPPGHLAKDQWLGKKPVIFVHGFKLGGGFGGDDGTWGILHKLVAENDPTVVILNFQWKTDASFLTIAGELAKAVDYAYLSTGNKVHIVAHSFGGVLSRVMLQNLRGDTANSASKVATLTTVGTPHSGIVTSGAPFEVEGTFLPHGGGAAILSICKQISCYEAGLDMTIAPWAKDDLACPAHIPTCLVGTISPTRGYINARLADLSNHPLPIGLKVLVLIGQIIENKPIEPTSAFSTPAFFTPTFSTDDDLISYFGQRFDPRAGRTLLSESLKGGATITERILGLPAGAEGFPGERVGYTMVTTYSYGPNHTPSDPVYPIGYGHSPAIPLVWVKAKLKGVNYEVNVPESCGTAATSCQHDTWLNIKAFLQTGCQAGQVMQNGVCVTSPPAITSLTATPPTIQNGGTSSVSWASTNATSCSITGTGAPATTANTGSFTTPSLTSGTTYTVTCTNDVATTQQNVTIAVAAATPAPAATGKLNDTGIPASQCYQTGSDTLVSCSSAGALALNSAQDGMTGRDANASTNSNTDGKLGFSFTSVPAAGSDPGGCVQDNVTGLMWEVKTADGGLRDWNKTYTNYSATDSLHGSATDATGFVSAVNAQGLCGYSDWRLPTADELYSLVDEGGWPPPRIDTAWFPNTKSGEYWTSSSSAELLFATSAWHVDFYTGSVSVGYHLFSNPYVRLVRGGFAATANRYTISTNGQEVTDSLTGLIWRRCSEGQSWNGFTCAGALSTYTHEQALVHAQIQTGWRLPNVRELASIADRSRYNPAIDPAVFPGMPLFGGGYPKCHWSSTPDGYSAGCFNFVMGSNFHEIRLLDNYVRLVRDGPGNPPINMSVGQF